MKRLFLAIDLSDEARETLEKRMMWMRSYAAVNVVPAANYHITLKFLGSVPDDKVAAIESVTDKIASHFSDFEMRVQGCGYFPTVGHPAVFWAGVEPHDPLVPIFEALEEAFEYQGFLPEKRAFNAHVTLARASRERHASIEFMKQWKALDMPPGPSFHAEKIVLFESVPGFDTSVYRPLNHFPLQNL